MWECSSKPIRLCCGAFGVKGVVKAVKGVGAGAWVRGGRAQARGRGADSVGRRASGGGDSLAGMNTAVSPTRRRLEAGQVERWIGAALGGSVRVVSATPLAGGEFATVLRVAVSDGREVVLKVGPAPGTRLLAYEDGMVAAEARYLRLAGPDALEGSRLPRLLGAGGGNGGSVDGASGGGGADGEWVVTELLPGVTLASLAAAGTVADPAVAPGVRAQVGAALARVHTVCSPDGVFGYDGARPCGATWGAAFEAIIASLLADAERWAVRLPVAGAEVMGLIARSRGVLDGVRRAALVHFDLWDGNVLCSPGTDRADGTDGVPVLTGLVDGERYLFGDPLVDFVSPALFRRIEDEPGHPFLAGYGRSGGFSGEELLRLALYRMHLYLLMVVEMPSRGRGGAEHAERAEELARLLLEAVGDVRERATAG
jgi:Phosphotransferase enzyme family